MSIQVIGASGVVANVDGTTYRALRVTVRQVEYGLCGSYRVSTTTGLITTLSNGSVLSMRWADPTAIALVWGVTLDANSPGSQTGAIFANLGLYIARGYTAVGSGGTAITPFTNQKLRTSNRQSRVNEIRVASTAALTDGTWTLDSQQMGVRTFSIRDTAVGVVGMPVVNNFLFGTLSRNGNPIPLVLANNEGFTVRGTAAMSGTTLTVSSSIAWSEVAIY